MHSDSNFFVWGKANRDLCVGKVLSDFQRTDGFSCGDGKVPRSAVQRGRKVTSVGEAKKPGHFYRVT